MSETKLSRKYNGRCYRSKINTMRIRLLAGVAVISGLILGYSAKSIKSMPANKTVQSKQQTRAIEMDTKLSDELRSLISRSFKTPESEWWVRDFSKSYKFFEDEQLVWVIDGETNESLLFYRQHGKEWFRLNNETTGLPLINKILRNKANRAPSPKNNVEQFAKLLMEWVYEPRGFVCSPTFLREKTTDEINSYLVKDSVGIDELKRVCISPEHLVTGDNWTLKFNVLDVNGSIQGWSVSGKLSIFGIDKIYRESIYPNGTFYYPNEL